MFAKLLNIIDGDQRCVGCAKPVHTLGLVHATETDATKWFDGATTLAVPVCAQCTATIDSRLIVVRAAEAVTKGAQIEPVGIETL